MLGLQDMLRAHPQHDSSSARQLQEAVASEQQQVRRLSPHAKLARGVSLSWKLLLVVLIVVQQAGKEGGASAVEQEVAMATLANIKAIVGELRAQVRQTDRPMMRAGSRQTGRQAGGRWEGR